VPICAVFFVSCLRIADYRLEPEDKWGSALCLVVLLVVFFLSEERGFFVGASLAEEFRSGPRTNYLPNVHSVFPENPAEPRHRGHPHTTFVGSAWMTSTVCEQNC
jgi:hypothetical protein